MRVPYFCGSSSGVDVVHLVFWHPVVRAPVGKPTAFLVSGIRKGKLGNSCKREWRDPGREEKGDRERPCTCLPGLRLGAMSTAGRGRGGVGVGIGGGGVLSSSAKAKDWSQDQTCCPQKHAAVPASPRKRPAAAKEIMHILEK